MPLTRSMVAAQAGDTCLSDQTGSRSGNSARTSIRTQVLGDRSTSEKEPPAERAKMTQVPKRGKKASLSRLLDMPPEVFNEIVTHLLPMDMLSLARSNKFFRAMFMSRTSLHLWRQALANAPEIPPCPPDLNEPQYISLLFSKTCSSCGVRVLRRMDPYLHVRLCNSCHDDEAMDFSEDNALLLFLPRSIEYEEMEEHAFAEWQKERCTQLRQRQEHGLLIADYLDMIEAERMIGLDELKRQRQTQIETRLYDEGWSKEDMVLSPENKVEWNKLMSQPKLITDRIWTNLRPKLEVLPESNRVYHGPTETENRRRKRVDKLHALVSNMQETLPPLVRFEFKPSLNITKTDGHDISRSNISDGAFSKRDYLDAKIKQPFPTVAEFLTWPMIKRLVGEETPVEDVETSFEAIRDEFDQAVVEWREKVERDLVEIWSADRDEQGVELEPSTKGKGKQVSKGGTPEDCERTVLVNNCSTDTSRAIELVLPEFIATYTKPDGTTTMDISDLPANQQLLLRTDTIFRSFGLLCTYPDIVPTGLSHEWLPGFYSEIKYGRPWNPSIIKRDNEALAIAKEMLALVRRSEASSVHMRAFGAQFRCGKCNRARVDTWEDLIQHYTTEQARWRKAQAKIKAEPKSGFVFNNTHGLDPENTKPFAHLMAKDATISYEMKRGILEMVLVQCMRCENMGIRARYSHSDIPSSSLIEGHLHDV